MYLVELDEDTGLVKDDINNDGWKAIKEFRIIHKKFGIKGFTLVALSCDYLTPFSMYNDDERAFRAMQEIYDSRLKFDITEDIWRAAFIKYKSLQRNNDLEIERLNQKIKSSILDRISIASDELEPDNSLIEKLYKDLNQHEERVSKFKERFDKNKTIQEHAVASNGYILSRIEENIAYSRKSKFVETDKEIENPNKLNLL